MKILEMENNNAFFLVKGERVIPKELERDHLLTILKSIYDADQDEDIEIPSEQEIQNIKNPVEQEIVSQILKKIVDFKNNVKNIKDEVESRFPPIQ